MAQAKFDLAPRPLYASACVVQDNSPRGGFLMKRALRDAILARDQYTCQSCGRQTRGQIYHILSRGQPGYELRANLITLCGRCQMLLSPMPMRVLKRLLRLNEQEIGAAKARVKAAIQGWILPTAKDNSRIETTCGQAVFSATDNQAQPLAEWKQLRPRAGKIWSPAEGDKLLAAFSAGAPIEDIARRLGRGPFSVQVRLCKLVRTVQS